MCDQILGRWLNLRRYLLIIWMRTVTFTYMIDNKTLFQWNKFGHSISIHSWAITRKSPWNHILVMILNCQGSFTYRPISKIYFALLFMTYLVNWQSEKLRFYPFFIIMLKLEVKIQSFKSYVMKIVFSHIYNLYKVINIHSWIG